MALSGQAQGEGWKRLWLQVGGNKTKWRSTTSPEAHGRQGGDFEDLGGGPLGPELRLIFVNAHEKGESPRY